MVGVSGLNNLAFPFAVSRKKSRWNLPFLKALVDLELCIEAYISLLSSNVFLKEPLKVFVIDGEPFDGERLLACLLVLNVRLKGVVAFV